MEGFLKKLVYKPIKVYNKRYMVLIENPVTIIYFKENKKDYCGYIPLNQILNVQCE